MIGTEIATKADLTATPCSATLIRTPPAACGKNGVRSGGAIVPVA